jgi:hypothetical protein
MQLPIDECQEWIWDSLNSTKDCLIFNTTDFSADAKIMERIRKTTGMELVQISTHQGYTNLWFGRYIDNNIGNFHKSNVSLYNP